MIHPGGARMIQDIGGKLGLKDTLSAKPWKSMNKLGNVASATVTDMIAMAWDELHVGDQAIVIGMGPGFVLDGVCLRMTSEAAIKRKRALRRFRETAMLPAIVVGTTAAALTA